MSLTSYQTAPSRDLKNLVDAGMLNVADGFGIATGFLKEIVG